MPEQGGIERSLPLPELEIDANQQVNPNRSPLHQALDMVIVHRDKFKTIEEHLRGQRDILIAAHDEVTKRVNEINVMDALAFYQDTVAAAQTNTALDDAVAGRGYIAVEDGSIVSIVARVDDPRTAGTLTVEPRINGTKIGFSVVLDSTNTTFICDRQDLGTDAFVAGDRIDCVITSTGAWTPVTANLDVSVGVVFAKGVR